MYKVHLVVRYYDERSLCRRYRPCHVRGLDSRISKVQTKVTCSHCRRWIDHWAYIEKLHERSDRHVEEEARPSASDQVGA